MRLQLKPTTHYTQSKFSHYKNKLNTNCKFKFPLRILIQSQIDQISKFSKILKKKPSNIPPSKQVRSISLIRIANYRHN